MTASASGDGATLGLVLASMSRRLDGGMDSSELYPSHCHSAQQGRPGGNKARAGAGRKTPRGGSGGRPPEAAQPPPRAEPSPEDVLLAYMGLQ